MYDQNISMLMDNLLSNFKGFCECASRFHGNTWGLTNNWNKISHVSRLICVMERSLPLQQFQSLNRPGVYLGQAFNSFLSIIRDENVRNITSFSVNSPASCWAIVVFCKWSCCSGGNDSVNQHSQITPHLCCHSRWRTFVSPSPWSFCGTLSHGVPVCW